jgi:PIN domain nuclease of toxin-antitoxin system
MRVLLDTHVFLWLASNDPRVKNRWIEIVEDDSNAVHLSIASLWEIVIKTSMEKLKLPTSFENLIDFHINKYNIVLLPVLPNHLIALQYLPHHHRDPFDRLIIAQSIAEDLPIMTADSKFDLYDLKRI